MDNDCIFCKIIDRKIDSWIIHENKEFISFLTPFPNTPGFTVIATKTHENSYILSLEENKYLSLMSYSRKIARILDKSLSVERTGLIIEGMGINHAHIKLIPMHGINPMEWEKMEAEKKDFSETYRGYLTSLEGPKMEDYRLNDILSKIKKHIG